MVDLLTHVLVTYAVAGAVAERGRISDRSVPLAMVGAVVPDLSRALLLAAPASVDAALGTTAWPWGVHTVGGVLAVSLAGAALLDHRRSVRGFAALVAGGCGHLVLDLGVVRADGTAPPYLFPFTTWLPPSANLYQSSTVWTLVVAVAVAGAVFAVRSGRLPVRGLTGSRDG